jgi:abequosyltransferase
LSAPRLSLCIATFNRGAFIGATLDSIISQATDEVEIVVVDGASSDDTEQVVRGRQQVFARLNYIRLAAKGGVDQDYCRAVAAARGEYCWLMSDDDLLKPGAIQAVLQAAQRAYSLIVVNSELRTADLAQLIHSLRLPIRSDRIYGPEAHDRLLIEVAPYISFIGCVVIRRQLWLERDKASYIGSEFVHVGVVFQKPLPAASLVLAEPLITIRCGNASWSSRYFEIWMLKWPQLIWSFHQFPAAVRSQVCSFEPWRSAKVICVMRAKGFFSLSEYERWLAKSRMPRARRLLAKGIALCPGCAVNFLVLAYFALFHGDDAYTLWEFHDSRYDFRRCLSQLWLRFAARLPNAAGAA